MPHVDLWEEGVALLLERDHLLVERGHLFPESDKQVEILDDKITNKQKRKPNKENHLTLVIFPCLSFVSISLLRRLNVD